MARGKKTAPETIYQVMTSYMTTHNYRESARDLNMPYATVKDIVQKNQDKDEFIKLRSQKEKEFADKASEIIDKGLVLLKRRMNRAIEEEENLDLLIDEIFATDKDELSQDEKNRLVAKIKTMQMQNMKDITTAIGTLYDKRALSRGESTQNVDFATNFDLNKLIDIAGYQKKDDSE
jgi:hypothetical protein